jgi:hypothetical protein
MFKHYADVLGFCGKSVETIVIGATAEKPAEGKKADVVRAAYDAAQIAVRPCPLSLCVSTVVADLSLAYRVLTTFVLPHVQMRLIKPSAKNYDVTAAVQSVTSDFGCKPVEGMLSCQHLQNVTDGKKRIILNPTPEARRDHETCTFEEGEVWGVDVLVVSGDDGKVSAGGRGVFALGRDGRTCLPGLLTLWGFSGNKKARSEESRTSVYKRSNDVTYQLKMKTSRTIFSEIQKKVRFRPFGRHLLTLPRVLIEKPRGVIMNQAGAFPFTLRCLEDEKRARMGVQEAVQHG